MLNEITIKAYAKVNLHLKVLPKRPDGFHSIESIFQKVNLYDVLHVKKHTQGAFCDLHVDGMDLPQNNTLVQAYTKFRELTGIQHGVRVSLKKIIPSGAGLGGGSSDAAALICALDELFNTELSVEHKKAIAMKTGSDVPFFLYGGCAVVTGRGELICEITPRKNLYFLIVQPDIFVSTKVAYEMVDLWLEKNNDLCFPNLAELEAMYHGPVSNWSFDNSFTQPLVNRYPIIGEGIRQLKAGGAIYANMSGSGSAIYGVFCKKEDAENAATQVCCKQRWYVVNACL